MIAQRLEAANAADSDQRVRLLYRWLFQREPTIDETDLGRQFVRDVEQDSESNKSLSAWAQYAQLLLLTNELSYVD
jgi:hypothetical protein